MNSRICFSLLGFIFSGVILASANVSAKTYPYRAQVIQEGAAVYQSADFDAPLVGTLRAGGTYDVSKGLANGAFYKIRVKPGVLGYIADTDVKPLFKTDRAQKEAEKKNAQAKKERDKVKQDREKKREEEKAAREKARNNRPFEFSRYGGLSYSMIQFQEETMNSQPKENLGFFGAKFSGSDLLISGLIPTEINLQMYSDAPSYYDKGTGRGASGWVFMGNGLFETYFPQGKGQLIYFGFGPMFRYSHFEVELNESGKVTPYTLEDIALGAAFNLGAAFRFGKFALRGEFQYYWEKLQYSGWGLALQYQF
ncbi:MAG: hypothetical protein COT73_06235 [Bdellovibrio sp. CG10_big_fil_rev_8_21_14_0_10_47_8]|nr:MAG: hypothetical protein COT73_06235 [Bdellovibrio sp. CG10_big_fil_rev_8_21_14_0_10_47_8]